MKRLYYLDLLRILAVFSMIMLHVSANYWLSVPPSSFAWNVINVYDSIARFCVPIFLMISGALFLSKDKIDIKKLYCKNIMRIVLAFLFWNFLYSLFMNQNVFSAVSLYSIKLVMQEFTTVHYHLLFLKALISLYVLTPVLKIIVNNKKAFNYLLLLLVLFSIVIPSCNYLISAIYIVYPSEKLLIIYHFLTDWIFTINIPTLSGYLIYFITGYYLFQNNITHKTTIYILGILGLLFTILATILISLKSGTANSIFYAYDSFNVFVTSIAIFVFFKENVSKIRLNAFWQKIIITLSNCSFGIYLIHDFFNMHFIKIGYTPLNFNSLLFIPIISLTIFLVSFCIIYLLSKIPIINKYLV